MPFSEEFRSVFENLIKQPLEEAGFSVKRADSDLNQQSILKEFVLGIARADLVVADVTGLNSNVMYEVGLAHALGARVVLLTQNISELPFDLRTYKANSYSTHFDDAPKIRETLKSIGTALLANDAEFGNPVQDYAPEFLREDAPVKSINLTSAGAESPQNPATDAPEEPEEQGYLEAMVQLETLGFELNEATRPIASRTVEIGELVEMHTRRMRRAQEQLGNRSASANAAIANQVAADLDSYSASLSPQAAKLEQVLSTYSAAVDTLSKEALVQSMEEVIEARDAIVKLLELESTFNDTSQNLRDFSTILADSPNMTRRFTSSARKAASVLDRIASAIDSASVETTRVRGILEVRSDTALRRLRPS